MELSEKQARVLQLVHLGRNVFFTGHAGTGKTCLLDRVVEDLKARHGPRFREKVAVTATTGIAASHIGGQTLNSLLGLGAVSKCEDFARAIQRMPHVRKKLRQLEVMIIDESGMLSAEFLEHMEETLRSVRGGGLPAGGLQIILAGDFFQLPPVSKGSTPGLARDVFLNHGHAFIAPAWARLRFAHVVLDRVYRQSDSAFVDALSVIRHANGSAARRALRFIVRSSQRPLSLPEGIVPTQIFSRNRDVDDMNELELRRVSIAAEGGLVSFASKDDVDATPSIPILSSSMTTHASTTAATATTTAATAATTTNPWGSFGLGGKGAPNNNSGAPASPASPASRVLAPVPTAPHIIDKLWRSDFFTRDCLAPAKLRMCVGAQVMLLRNLEPATGLVNGSRGVVVRFVPVGGLGLGMVRTVGAIDPSALRQWPGTMIPVVRFVDGRELAVPPARFSSIVHGAGECTRFQLPLKLAWAVTVHKSQVRVAPRTTQANPC
jgi:hypothetical protein